jgi:chromate reductase, NAD(P)H dehydrogenase (quinone)
MARAMEAFHIVGIPGSLRARSFNRALLRAAAGLVPAGATFEIVELHDVPPYDDDRDENRGGHDTPAAVTRLRERCAAADAMVLASPEYNWGPSGVMKNAIDWLSRPPRESPLHHKAVALMGCSGGPAGTGRAQLQLRQHLQYLTSYVLPEPQVQLGFSRERFDDELRLVDEEAVRLVAEQLEALVRWARAVRELT